MIFLLAACVDILLIRACAAATKHLYIRTWKVQWIAVTVFAVLLSGILFLDLPHYLSTLGGREIVVERVIPSKTRGRGGTRYSFDLILDNGTRLHGGMLWTQSELDRISAIQPGETVKLQYLPSIRQICWLSCKNRNGQYSKVYSINSMLYLILLGVGIAAAWLYGKKRTARLRKSRSGPWHTLFRMLR